MILTGENQSTVRSHCPSLFWYVTRLRLVVCYRRLGQSVAPIFKDQAVQEECREQVDALFYKGLCGQWLVFKENKETNQIAGAWRFYQHVGGKMKRVTAKGSAVPRSPSLTTNLRPATSQQSEGLHYTEAETWNLASDNFIHHRYHTDCSGGEFDPLLSVTRY